MDNSCFPIGKFMFEYLNYLSRKRFKFNEHARNMTISILVLCINSSICGDNHLTFHRIAKNLVHLVTSHTGKCGQNRTIIVTEVSAT